MSKFDELYEMTLNSVHREYLPLNSVMKVYDDTIRSLGLQSNVNGMADGYTDENGDLTADKMELLKAATATSFQQSMINPMYRDDLVNHGYELLVQIADEMNLWSQGRHYPNNSVL